MLALGNDVVMLNDHARRALSPADQAALISQATETLSAEAVAAGARGRRRPPGAVTVDLPSGAVARMFCRPVGEFGLLAASAEPGRSPTAWCTSSWCRRRDAAAADGGHRARRHVAARPRRLGRGLAAGLPARGGELRARRVAGP